MVGTINIETIEQLQPFLNNDNIMEIVIRGRNSKFKAFHKVVLNLSLIHIYSTFQTSYL